MSNQREILFRGKSIHEDEWTWGHFYESRHESWILDRDKVSVKILPETIGQYTGLKDKNGVKIFEGDLVKYDQKSSKGNGPGVVSYDIDKSRYCILHDSVKMPFIFEGYEIVGNIHDNPELLTTNQESK